MLFKYYSGKFKTFSQISILCVCCGCATAAPLMSGQYQLGRDYPIVADVWTPLARTNRHVIFADMSAAYSLTKSSLGITPGIIYRQLFDTHAYGGYLYAAYNRTPARQDFWTANPGVEYLNSNWHVNWNAYIPLNGTKKEYGATRFASQFGDYRYTSFVSHQQFDRLARRADETGAGTDLIIRYDKLPLKRPTSVSAGAYYFNSDSSILGVAANATITVAKYFSATLSYSYDNQRSGTLTLGVGFHTADDTKDWAAATVQHNIASLGTANTIPINDEIVPVSGKQVFRDNIWFFKPGGTPFSGTVALPNECTFEHPCGGFNKLTPAEISLITTGANIYLKPGDYSVGDTMYMYNKQSIYGRSSDYKRPAKGNDRPLLNVGAISISDSTDNIISDLRFENNGDISTAIFMDGDENIMLNNLEIGVDDQVNTTKNYVVGVDIVDSNHVTIMDSTIYANNYNTPLSTAASVQLAGANDIIIKNSTLVTKTIGALNFGGVNVFAVGGNSSVNVLQSTLISENSGDSATETKNVGTTGSANLTLYVGGGEFTVNNTGADDTVVNITLANDSSAVIENATLNATTDSAQTNGGAFNVVLNGSAVADVTGSTVTGNATSTEGKTGAVNFQASNNSILNIRKSKVVSIGHSHLVDGNTNVTSSDSAQVTVADSDLKTEMTGGEAAVGVAPSGAVSLWLLGDSSITVHNSTITATAGNIYTGPVAIQAQNNSVITVDNSTLTTNQLFGNRTHVYGAAVGLTSTSTATITNSTINMHAAGVTTLSLPMIAAYNTTSLTLNNNTLNITNRQRGANGSVPMTVGILASDAASLSLKGNIFSINGIKTNSNIDYL